MATEVDLETPTTSSLAINRKTAVIVDIDECGEEVERRPENARKMPQRRRSIGVTRTAYDRIALRCWNLTERAGHFASFPHERVGSSLNHRIHLVRDQARKHLGQVTRSSVGKLTRARLPPSRRQTQLHPRSFALPDARPLVILRVHVVLRVAVHRLPSDPCARQPYSYKANSRWQMA